MSFEIILLALAGTTILALGVVVFSQTWVHRYGWFFAFTMLFVSLWAFSDIGILTAQSPALLNVCKSLFYWTPMAIPLLLVLFSQTFPNKIVSRSRLWLIAALPLAAIVFIAIYPDWLLQEVNQSGVFNRPIPITAHFIAYSAYFSIMFFALYFLLYKAMRREKDLLSRVQLQYMFSGVILSSVPALLTNLTLPIKGQGQYIWLGPLFTSIFAGFMAVSIVRHKMFSIRLVAARIVGYGFSVALLAAVYGVIVFTALDTLLNLRFSWWIKLILSAAAALIGLTFHRVQRKFTRLTDRLFFQDNYDPQELFDALNQVLVSNIEIDKLANGSAEVIEQTLKLEYCAVGVVSDGGIRSFSKSQALNIQRVGKALADTQLFQEATILAEWQPHGHEGAIKTVLREANVAALTQLGQTSSGNAALGYLIVGEKKSGNPFTSNDKRTLDTVSKELSIAIQNALHYEEIQNFNQTLQARVDDATRKLRRTNQRLKELDEAKDDFVSMASHQLRTPLTAIKGNVSMVMEGDAGPVTKTQVELLGQAFASSQRMVFLIADLLNVSRLKTGKFVIEPGRVQLANMVEQEVKQLMETAQSRQLTLSFTKPETFCTLKLDETKTRQVVMNFIDNAIYYTPSCGAIEVTVKETEREVEFRVKDNGIGVPRHEQPHLFTKFYRADNARKARPDGTGLGLFMAKKVIVAQGGAIIFETREGKGSTFGFRFPKANLLAESQN